jgi:hypothetical protein
MPPWAWSFQNERVPGGGSISMAGPKRVSARFDHATLTLLPATHVTTRRPAPPSATSTSRAPRESGSDMAGPPTRQTRTSRQVG